MTKILIIDDDKDMCMLLTRFLARNNYDVYAVNSGKEAIEWMRKNSPELVLCDFKLDDITGSELLPGIKKMHPHAHVIIITGYSDIKDAVEVMKLGAYDYVTKPLYPDEILLTIKKALTGPKQEAFTPLIDTPETSADTKRHSPGAYNGHYLSTDSPEYTSIVKQIDMVAPTNYSVIIYGESGSGKEAVAQQIHMKSTRKDKPFMAIDCGALSKELAGSELFGHEKGAFTGALTSKTGSFELANGGTIFLDEIGNLTYDIQVSLLRVVQERKIKKLGGTRDIHLDVRIIVASNENLWNATLKGKFREDLYHRFNEFSINLPPLRERKSDIMVFARHFLNITNTELGKDIKGFSDEVQSIFLSYPWYGNLRELKNVIKRSTLLTDGAVIEVKSLPFEISNFQKLQFDDKLTEPVLPDIPQAGPDNLGSKLKSTNITAEYEVIMDALKQANFNKSKAAQLLNIDRKTLYNKLNQYKELMKEQ